MSRPIFTIDHIDSLSNEAVRVEIQIKARPLHMYSIHLLSPDQSKVFAILVQELLMLDCIFYICFGYMGHGGTLVLLILILVVS